ncbi:MAG: gamma-glutamyl phosphate reductase [Bacteroidia bacterium]|jgi:gamma-glutamyl phosphate reductase
MINTSQLVQDVLDGNESADKACEILLNEMSTLKRCFSHIYEGSIDELNKAKKLDTVEDWLELERSHILKFKHDVNNLLKTANPTGISLVYTMPNRNQAHVYHSKMSMVVLRNFLDSFDFELKVQEREIYTSKR